MSILKLYSAILMTLLFVACSQPGSNKEENSFDLHNELIVPEAGGIFRGHDIGEQADMVLSKEKLAASIKSDSLVQYSLTFLDDRDTLDVEIYYAFDSFGLFEIQTDMFTYNDGKNKEWMAQLEGGLTNSYGKPKHTGNIFRWTTPSPSNNIIEITLSIEKNEMGESFISLNILEPLENEL